MTQFIMPFPVETPASVEKGLSCSPMGRGSIPLKRRGNMGSTKGRVRPRIIGWALSPVVEKEANV